MTLRLPTGRDQTKGTRMTIEVTLAQVRDAAKAAVEARGSDYIYKNHYDSCRNVQHEWDEAAQVSRLVPGCLVGDVMHRLGVPLEPMGAPSIADSTADDLLHALKRDDLITTADGETLEMIGSYLMNAQIVQDKEDQTWGNALEAAENWAKNTAAAVTA